MILGKLNHYGMKMKRSIEVIRGAGKISHNDPLDRTLLTLHQFKDKDFEAVFLRENINWR